MRALLLVGSLIAGAGPAAAEPAPDARDDAAWRLYHDAFDALLEGKRGRAAGLVARLRREHAGHPAAALVAASPLAVTGAPDRRRRARPEAPSAAARAELALFQTLHGVTLGIELCAALDCDSLEPYVGLGLLGGVTGSIFSLKVVNDLTSGQRALLNGGTAWGAANALLAMIAFEPDTDQAIAYGLIAGQGVGFAVGAALFGLRPTAGQVALASSGGQWAAALMGLTLAAASTGPSRTEIALSLLIAADAGLGMGAYLAWLRPDISRAQTLVIDASGIVGGVGGAGLGVLISGAVGDRTTAAMAALGAAAGLGAAAYFTRGWGDDGDGDDDGPRAVLLPAERGRGGVVGLAGTW